MTDRLGFATFYTQGGDWGSGITTTMATLYPDSVRGIHVNMPWANIPAGTVKLILASILPAGWVMPANENLGKFLPLSENFAEMMLEFGYLHLQATKPDTIGSALNSSPLGLAAYILEKFSTWTDAANRNSKDGNLTKKFSLDELLDNVMVYWTTRSITTAMRFYAENFGKESMADAFCRNPTKVPAAVMDAAHEITHTPESVVRHKYHNLISFTTLDVGGHFLAFEEPQLLADDFLKFAARVETILSKKADKKKSEL